MNERIKELLEQAGVKFVVMPKDTIYEMFAELIVRECAQVCRDQPNHYALKTDRDNCAVAIKQHFGVEE